MFNSTVVIQFHGFGQLQQTWCYLWASTGFNSLGPSPFSEEQSANIQYYWNLWRFIKSQLLQTYLRLVCVYLSSNSTPFNDFNCNEQILFQFMLKSDNFAVSAFNFKRVGTNIMHHHIFSQLWFGSMPWPNNRIWWESNIAKIQLAYKVRQCIEFEHKKNLRRDYLVLPVLLLCICIKSIRYPSCFVTPVLQRLMARRTVVDHKIIAW